jgi:hypothetical protein
LTRANARLVRPEPEPADRVEPEERTKVKTLRGVLITALGWTLAGIIFGILLYTSWSALGLLGFVGLAGGQRDV